MRQLEYTNSDFTFEFYVSNYFRCLISTHYDYFLLRPHSHLYHKWHVAETHATSSILAKKTCNHNIF